MKNNVLEFENVTCKFKEFELFLNFSIKKGEFITFFGPSGAGKTTALHLIAGVLKPDLGRILLSGNDVTNLPPWKRKIGVVFQDYSLFPNMNVGKNIAYGVKAKNSSPIVEDLLKLVDLENFQHRQIASLSGGQKQRVALARALATNPDILILDEPLSALDGILRKNLFLEIKNLHKENNYTTIYITHDLNEALSFSDKIAMFSEGKIVQYAKPSEIYENPANLEVARLTGSVCEILVDGEIIYFRPEDLGFGEKKGKVNFEAEITDCLYQGSYSEYLLKQEGYDKVITIPSYLFDEKPKKGIFHLKSHLAFNN